MTRFSLHLVTLAAMTTLAACGGGMQPVTPGAAQPASQTVSRPVQDRLTQIVASSRAACPYERTGYARCFGWATTMTVRPVRDGRDITPGGCILDENPCLGPAALWSAYNIASEAPTQGARSTVGIVDWGGYPTAASDVALYRKTFGLPAANLTIVNQRGKTSPLPPTDTGDDVEQMIDLDSVSAICPRCRIVLVEADTSKTNDLRAAETTALKMADVVSNSWGYVETKASDSLWDAHRGKVVTASAGDSGARGGTNPPLQPCTFAGVICVGGTRLTMQVVDRIPERVSEVVWNDLGTPQCPTQGKCATSSGCSTLVAKPAWQRDTGCTMRTANDIAAVATDVLGVYQGTCCTIVRGTSVASPIIAAMYALAGNAKTETPAMLYAQAGWHTFDDITSGTNQFQGVTYLCPRPIAYVCKAGRGYDGPTGWGTPDGLGVFTPPTSD
jgi:subtilase family serine protease